MSVFSFLLCAGLASAQAPAAVPAPAAKPKAAHELKGQDAVFKTQDGWTIEGKYLPAQPDKLTLVLLPGRGQTIAHWYLLARALEKAGYGYLAIDMRGHGQSNIGPDGLPHSFRDFKISKAQNDWDDMRFDVEAAFDWLKSQGVAEEHAAVIGDDVGGSVGLKFAAVHPGVGLFVWLTPGIRWQEVLTINAIRAYKGRPIMMVYSDLDRRSTAETSLLYNFAKMSPAGGKIAWASGVANVHGFKLAHYGPVVSQIVDWLGNPVTPEPPAVSTGTLGSPATGQAPVEEPSATPDASGE